MQSAKVQQSALGIKKNATSKVAASKSTKVTMNKVAAKKDEFDLLTKPSQEMLDRSKSL